MPFVAPAKDVSFSARNFASDLAAHYLGRRRRLRLDRKLGVVEATTGAARRAPPPLQPAASMGIAGAGTFPSISRPTNPLRLDQKGEIQ